MKDITKLKKYIPEKKFGYFEYQPNNDIRFDLEVAISSGIKESDLQVGYEFEVEFEKQNNKLMATSLVLRKKQTIPIQKTTHTPTIEATTSTNVSSLLPKDTRQTVNISSIDNFLLKLQKSGMFTIDNRGSYKFDIKEHSVFTFQVPFDKLAQRQAHNVQGMGLDAQGCKLKLDWRMALGLGNESVFETSMTLHHVYGIPYIPASSLKGIIRSWIITNQFNNDEGEAIQDKAFCDVFGCPKELHYTHNGKAKNVKSYYELHEEKKGGDREGKLFFFDAYPVSPPAIKTDIMNPHYGPYYEGSGKPPSDYYNPIPIPFLTIENTSFQFHIGIRKKENISIRNTEYSKLIPNEQSLSLSNIQISENSKVLDIMFAWLKLSLMEHGMGAKTSVGYGYFV